MENRFTQLRFDISEKVRLQPQQPGMNTLLELDLYPDVEIKDEGQHLKIQGYLRLNGMYIPQQEGEVEGPDHTGLHTEAFLYEEEHRSELAYVIPVEITLPADRAEQAHISAEVESFDYQVLSPFELQIEAILMIDGLLPDPNEEAEKAGSHEEREMDDTVPEFSGAPVRPISIQSEEEGDVEPEPEVVSRAREQDEENTSGKRVNREQGEEAEEEPEAKVLPHEVPETEEKRAQREPEPAGKESGKKKTAEEKETAFPKETVGRKETVPEQKEVSTEEKTKEKQRTEPERQTIFAQSPREFWEERQKENQFEEVFETEVEEELNSGGEAPETDQENKKQTDWIRWLVGNKEEQFVGLKIVIVQRDETIDHVAARYDVAVSQLMKLNQLQTDRLEEGQILYVPDYAKKQTT
ncbi:MULTISPECIES: LysM peptidoglycan-binding domain-containing protein [Thermoactinomyces]|uniref:LysM peptidoglycan-binding domain-containing protein n=1 Tax=Thermoactinomyces daqus TaxID=1329516 RepID=A0A7W1X7I7_9BACL|nr:LysM peptidoglycan-binding domain-containing protein [Thermoactinomyces daqus]MBA4541404.1 LysM peptidoglycan-binding domain-containing protein [Thermoactinomyces daqus]MBH8603636.1 LysM peptidoglycan-binding domain-containing protein [Thermoactinomyces sp. CICC 10522]MBH8606801.1 LysM peptidoglycan-binding domain-containing protein [Thermoactinomyces sp. CICC 10521]